jgi:hypothetical protein
MLALDLHLNGAAAQSGAPAGVAVLAAQAAMEPPNSPSHAAMEIKTGWFRHHANTR